MVDTRSPAWRSSVWRAAVLVVIIVAATAGVARGYWGGPGGGAGSATTTTIVPVTLNSATPDAMLYPGGWTGVDLIASNPNASTVSITALELDPGQGTAGFSVDTGHSACRLSGLRFSTQTNGGVGWIIPAKVGTTDGTLSISLSNSLFMSVDADNACQGAIFTVFLAAHS